MRAGYSVGVDVSGTKIAAGLVERKGRVTKDDARPTPSGGPFAIVDAIIDSVESVSEGINPSDLAGIGIGLPAQIDFYRQTVEFCTNLPLAGVDMRSLVMSRVKHAVTMDNDGHLAALGEHRYGAAKGVKDFMMVVMGTGIGSGMFFAGQPFRGHRGLGGEFGHTVVQIDGPPCPCGGVGHLEALAADPAIARRAREVAATFKGAELKRLAGGDAEAVTSEHVVEAARNGDGEAAKLLSEAGLVLGKALVGIVNLLNPEMIVIGGGLGGGSALITERAAEAVASEALAGRRDVRLVQAHLGNDAGVLGAAALAFDEYDSREGLHR